MAEGIWATAPLLYLMTLFHWPVISISPGGNQTIALGKDE
jgi:hypothetical protein